MGLGLTVLLVISIIGGWWKPLVTFVLPAGVAAAGSFIGQATSAYFELARMPKLRLLHWCFWGGLTVMGAGWVSGTVGGPKQFVDVVNGAIYVWAMAALLTGDLGVIVNAATREQ